VSFYEFVILSIKDFTKRQGKSQSEIQAKSRKRKHDFQRGKIVENS